MGKLAGLNKVGHGGISNYLWYIQIWYIYAKRIIVLLFSLLSHSTFISVQAQSCQMSTFISQALSLSLANVSSISCPYDSAWLHNVLNHRSAKEAEEKIKKALEKGESLPTEARFDSNCITPGNRLSSSCVFCKLNTNFDYMELNKIRWWYIFFIKS